VKNEKHFRPVFYSVFKKTNDKNSFTLVEVLIVVLIIGILINLSIPQFIQLKRRAYFAEAKIMVAAIADALWRYYLENGSFPVSGYGPPPASIDVNIPESDYFGYVCAKFGTGVYVAATYNGFAEVGEGKVHTYMILYLPQDPVSVLGAAYSDCYQQMNDTWYKCFCHMRSYEHAPPWPMPGWP
jgi:prepilin-type N-terminal cleavage/methylation domain-containing protein